MSQETSPTAVVVITPDEWAYVVRSLGLSQQQANVVRLMLDGHQDKEIATALNLRVSTARTYVARIFSKARVKGRVQLAVLIFSMLRQRPPVSSTHTPSS